jgi:hypothetical protein
VSSEPQPRHATTPSASKYPKASSWVGWIAFAAVVMVVLGGVHIMQGLVALFGGDQLLEPRRTPIVELDKTAWGWTHVISGCVVLVAGLCVFAGQTWARAVGVLIAVVSVVVSFGLLGTDPVRSLVTIVLGVVVILALSVHGSDIKP